MHFHSLLKYTTNFLFSVCLGWPSTNLTIGISACAKSDFGFFGNTNTRSSCRATMQRNLKFKIHKCSYSLLFNLKSEVDIPIWQFDMPSEELNVQANWTLFCHIICKAECILFDKMFMTILHSFNSVRILDCYSDPLGWKQKIQNQQHQGNSAKQFSTNKDNITVYRSVKDVTNLMSSTTELGGGMP